MKNDPLEYIRCRLSREELLLQLAEECAELGKAALKLRRIYDGSNPTPIKHHEAYNNLIEEIADVTLCVEVLGLNTPEALKTVGEIWGSKLDRWKQRLMEAESKDLE